MKRTRLIVAMLAMVLGTLEALPQSNVPMFQSAELGSTGPIDSAHLGISDKSFLGWRFHVESPVTITGVGGHFFRWGPSDDGSFFALITRLDRPDGFPSRPGVLPFVSERIVGTTLGVVTSEDTADYFFPLRADLSAGDYALVFGSGMFGDPSSGDGFAVSLPIDNQRSPDATFFAWEGYNLRWSEATQIPGAPRFVVYTVPEPAICWLFAALASGSLLCAKVRDRRRWCS